MARHPSTPTCRVRNGNHLSPVILPLAGLLVCLMERRYGLLVCLLTQSSRELRLVPETLQVEARCAGPLYGNFLAWTAVRYLARRSPDPPQNPALILESICIEAR